MRNVLRLLAFIGLCVEGVEVTRNLTLRPARIERGVVRRCPAHNGSRQEVVKLLLKTRVTRARHRITLDQGVFNKAAFQNDGQVVGDIKVDRTEDAGYLCLVGVGQAVSKDAQRVTRSTNAQSTNRGIKEAVDTDVGVGV